MGVGGEAVAGSLAEAGLKVVGIEGNLVGGECPYWGCIPSKMIIRAANALTEARRVNELAGQAQATPSWQPVATRIREEATTDWNDQIAVDRFTGKGGQFIRGWGKLAGHGVVDVDGRQFEAARGVVLATGSTAVIPSIDGLAGTPFWTNREAMETTDVPASLLVLGGGAVGLELAQAFARFGSQVTVVEALDRLLPVEEPQASDIVRTALEADGVDIRTGVRAQKVTHEGNQFTMSLHDGTHVRAARLLVCVGRRPQLNGLGVESVGLDPSADRISADTRLRAGENLWAVGDVTGHGAFTHTATYQANIVIRDILGQGGPPADYRAMPRVTFTDPEVGAVGLTESQACAAGTAVEVAVASVPSTARGWIHKAGNDGVIKLVVDARRDVLVGATSVGPNGGEVLGALAVALHAEVPIQRLRHMIYAYPTFHRGIEDAVRELSHGARSG
jgi:pyruvate/2-oxoglutarate dehydrogenase complex dihydrolipoamide dehydrogenase (E3) component